jgi:hypothetical protein
VSHISLITLEPKDSVAVALLFGKEEKEKNIMGTSNTGHTIEYWYISRAT